MIDEIDVLWRASKELFEPGLPFDQRQGRQVLAIDEQEVEREID
jgi:hypothetical protein